MRIFLTKGFLRFARKDNIKNQQIIEAIEIAARGVVDANLGGGIIKQRIVRKGRGKSSGYRTLIAYQFGDLAIFLYGFAKKEKDNIEERELEDLRNVGTIYISFTAKDLEHAITTKALTEVTNDEKKKISK